MISSDLGRHPIIVAIVGPNGAGKTFFFQSLLSATELPFVNADEIAASEGISAYEAAEQASAIREDLLHQRKSFVFESVFSDPVGEKLQFLQKAVASDYNVILCFIGISSTGISKERVAMRVQRGGHDVPTEKLMCRFPRTLANLKAAVQVLPIVLIYDNDNLSEEPFRKVMEFQKSKEVFRADCLPSWLVALL